MRTVIPPQFTGEDLQRLLTAALSAPAVDGPTAAATPAGAIPPVDLTPLETLETGDAWDEKW